MKRLNRRPRSLLAGVGVTAVIAASAIVALIGSGGPVAPVSSSPNLRISDGGLVHVASDGARSGILSTASCPAVLPARAHWAPASASTSPSVSCSNGFVMWSYALTGAANENTIPAGGPTVFDGTQHPATIVTLSALRDPSGTLPPPAADPTYFTISTVVLGAGRTARVSVPKSGYGPYRVAWVQSGYLYTLLSARGFTRAGQSGVPLTDLERMAQSVR